MPRSAGLRAGITMAGSALLFLACASPSNGPNLAENYSLSGTISPAAVGNGAIVTLGGSGSATATADSTGLYRFTGLANGSYTVTPSRVGYTFSPTSRSAVIQGMNVTGLDFTATSFIANVTVNAGTEFQVIDGMGVNANVYHWNNGELEQALDLLVDQNGASLFRVVRDHMAWLSSPDLIPGLHRLDPDTLALVHETPFMQDIWGTIGYLNSKGIRGSQIMLCFMGWTPMWMGGSGAYGIPSYIDAGREDEYATMIAALVYYARRVKNLDFTLIAPLNELDYDGKEGPHVDPPQYATIMHLLALELDAMGLTEMRFVGGETAGNPDAHIAALMADPLVAARIDHLSFHNYSDTPTNPRTSYAGRNYWMTETSVWCSTCDQNGSPSQGEFQFASGTADVLIGDLVNGFAAALVWEGYDGFYYHHNASSSWGLLDYDGAAYAPRKRFYVYAQINAFVRPGDRRIQLSESVSGLGPVLAVEDPVGGRVSIVGHVTSSTPVTLQVQLNNLAIVPSAFTFYFTNASTNFQRQADVPVVGQTFSVTIPGNTIFSLSSDPAPIVTPKIDLVPGVVSVMPDPPLAGQPARYSLTVSNEEETPSHSSRWVLLAGNTVLGQGDVIVPAYGSVMREVVATIPQAGNYPLRLVVDSLASVIETNENNNASVRTLTVAPAPANFPLTSVLDDFNRANGSIGPNWVDMTSSYSILSQCLAPSPGHNYIEWGGAVYGPDQEVFVTLQTIAPSAPEHNLMLKTQGATWSASHLEVSYEAVTSSVHIYTFTAPGTWAARGTITGVTFAAGDQFGARALGDGTVLVYKNGALLGTRSAAGWIYAGSGGRIGLSVASAPAARFDNFGGGTVPQPVAADPPPPPAGLTVSTAFPNPTRKGVAFTLALPGQAEVDVTVHDIQGREVWRAPARRYEAGRWSVIWDGLTAQGLARAGVYLARVRVGGQLFRRQIAIIR